MINVRVENPNTNRGFVILYEQAPGQDKKCFNLYEYEGSIYDDTSTKCVCTRDLEASFIPNGDPLIFSCLSMMIEYLKYKVV